MSHVNGKQLSEGPRFDRNLAEIEVPLKHVDHRQREHRRLFEYLHQSNLRLKAEIAERMKSEEKLREVNSQLEAAVEQLAQMAARDGLTGVANRGRFEEMLAKEWNRCLRSVKPMSLILIDVDLFKQYNDVHGHPAGDECLKLVAQSLQESALDGREISSLVTAGMNLLCCCPKHRWVRHSSSPRR